MIQAVIIDDESRAAKSLEMMLEHPAMEVKCMGVAHQAMDGIALIKNLKPDLVFLDINMPGMTGFDVLKYTDEYQFKTVFVTAHEEHAVKAIKHRVFDYLLKPVDPDELMECVNRVRFGKYHAHETEFGTQLKPLAIPVKDGMVFVKCEDIVWIEGDGSYTTIYAKNNQSYVSSKHLKEIESILPPGMFFRIHKSHVINVTHIHKYLKTDGYYIQMNDGAVLELARRRKEDLLKLLQGNQP